MTPCLAQNISWSMATMLRDVFVVGRKLPRSHAASYVDPKNGFMFLCMHVVPYKNNGYVLIDN